MFKRSISSAVYIANQTFWYSASWAPLGMVLNEEFKLVDIEQFAPEMENLQEIFADQPEIERSDDLKEASRHRRSNGWKEQLWKRCTPF